MIQTSLFDQPDDETPLDKELRHGLFAETSPGLIAAFKKYHTDNPEVYELFERFTLQAAGTHKRFSIWMVANRARWYTNIETTGPDFKISNDLLAVYARLIAIRNPHVADLFTFHRMKRDRVPPVH